MRTGLRLLEGKFTKMTRKRIASSTHEEFGTCKRRYNCGNMLGAGQHNLAFGQQDEVLLVSMQNLDN